MEDLGIDPRIIATFGSETRVRILAVLANAHRPLTAYRVGVTGGVPFPRLYREIARLEKAGLVERKGSGWILVDRDVAALLRKRVRIVWDEDWFAEVDRRAPSEDLRLDELRRLPHLRPPQGWKPRVPGSLDRPKGKDRMLRQMGLRPAVDADQ
jgi:DNA-binding transcriptional ArsR family regulator